VSEQTAADQVSKRIVLYNLAGMDAVRLRRDVSYGATDSGALTMDLYSPPDAPAGARLPAVIIVSGFPGAGIMKAIGCAFKDMGSTTSWARLIAASGIIAVAYSNQEPLGDVQTLVEHLRRNADALGIDQARIGLWASSGNVPLALWLLMQKANDCLKCAVLCYGYTLDGGESTAIADAAKTWGFVNPCAGRSAADIVHGSALFIARAGQDQFAGLNERLDRFVAAAMHANLAITAVNHPTGPHAFDLFDDSPTTRDVIRQILAFLRFNLLGTE
jgi:acetyl esterase/lipase